MPIQNRQRLLAFVLLVPVLAQRGLAQQSDTTQADTLATATARDSTALSVRALYTRGDYTGAITAAEASLRTGHGSTDVQSWRLISMTRMPSSAPTALRAARKMANMHPVTPSVWVALAAAAATVPDSMSVALSASERALKLAPRDPATIWVRARVLTAAGRVDEARTLLNSVTPAIAADSLIVTERAALQSH